MRITKITLENFRNIKKASFCPNKSCNIFIGENGQGKTNLLEAICLFTGEKSFRKAKESDFIRFDSPFARLDVEFFSQGREQQASICFGEKKQITLNNVKKRSPSAFNGVLCMVIFSPEDLRMVKDGPEERRRIIDTAVTQLIPSYHSLIASYSRTLFQRNSLLRDIADRKKGIDMLDIWDERLSLLGSKIVKLRRHYITRITPFAGKHYEGISGSREELSFEYVSSSGESQQEFFDLLRKNRAKDIEQGSTSVGPHRDDIEILLNSRSARLYGSQGQQRSAVLAMKLSEAELLYEKYGEPPLLLLDDVLSELDFSRQSYLVSRLTGYQVFITCCEAHASLSGRLYGVKNGKIARLKKCI